jgi:hypothetical protein
MPLPRICRILPANPSAWKGCAAGALDSDLFKIAQLDRLAQILLAKASGREIA